LSVDGPTVPKVADIVPDAQLLCGQFKGKQLHFSSKYVISQNFVFRLITLGLSRFAKGAQNGRISCVEDLSNPA